MKLRDDIRPALILAGGSELVAISLWEAFAALKVPMWVIGLGRPSILRGLPEVQEHGVLPWPQCAGDPSPLTQWLESRKSLAPWVAYATEDGGLRYLMEGRKHWRNFLIMAGSPLLRLGGLDKSETFQFLQSKGLGPLLPKTQCCNHPDEIPAALEQFGPGSIFKPSLKPHDMRLPKGNSKILEWNHGERAEEFAKRWRDAWNAGDGWVVQERLRPSPRGEALCWVSRSPDGNTLTMTAMERLKQPASGGSACWVCSEPVANLSSHAIRIVEALQFRGLAELPFLLDSTGNWKLLELNARPWLQVGLARRAGAPLIQHTHWALCVRNDLPPTVSTRSATWISLERLGLALLESPVRVSRLIFTQLVPDLRMARPYFPPYTGSPWKIKIRWLSRMMQRGANYLVTWMRS